MRAIITTGTDDFTLTAMPVPEPAAGEVRIKVRAAAVNPVDLATAHGVFHQRGIIPAGAAVGMGWDVSGIVDAVGEGVRGFTVGTAVAGARLGIGPVVGTYSEVVVLPASDLAAVPVGLDTADAAAVPVIAQTAAQAVAQLGTGGRRLLIVGASGGVGGHAVALAARTGATITAVGKPSDVDDLHHHGADTVVTDVSDLADARFDLVFDPAGVGAPLLDLLVDNGRYLGTMPGNAPESVRGISSGWMELQNDGAALAGLLADVASGALPLRIAGEYPLEDAALAHKAFEAKTTPGRWLLRP